MFSFNSCETDSLMSFLSFLTGSLFSLKVFPTLNHTLREKDSGGRKGFFPFPPFVAPAKGLKPDLGPVELVEPVGCACNSLS